MRTFVRVALALALWLTLSATQVAGQIFFMPAQTPGTRGTLVKLVAPDPESAVKACGGYFLFIPAGTVKNEKDQVFFSFNLEFFGRTRFDNPAYLPLESVKPVVRADIVTPEFVVLRTGQMDRISEVEVHLPPAEMAKATCFSNPKA